MRIRVILGKTKFKEIAVDVPENITQKDLENFAEQKFPDWELVDVIYPGDEDYELPLDNS